MGAERELTPSELQQIEEERNLKHQTFIKEEELRRQKSALEEEKRNRGTGCEIITFSQYEMNSGGGIGIVSGGVVGGGGHRHTCVDLTIRNNDSVERAITNSGIVAVTRKGNRRNPEGFMTKIKPGGMYQGTVCFGENLSTINKLECEF